MTEDTHDVRFHTNNLHGVWHCFGVGFPRSIALQIICNCIFLLDTRPPISIDNPVFRIIFERVRNIYYLLLRIGVHIASAYFLIHQRFLSSRSYGRSIDPLRFFLDQESWTTVFFHTTHTARKQYTHTRSQ
jgi:hypothetical protein